MQKISLLIAVLFVVNISTAQVPIQFARYPAPSPDGKMLAFNWQGDIWMVGIEGGTATRLTVHEAYDYAPVWSPDGTKLAFTSDRFGNDDVFVLDLKNGEVQRLTYWSGRDRAVGWTPDGQAVLMESARDWETYGFGTSLYVARLDGGTPYRFNNVPCASAALSPDGKKLAFVRRDSSWWRKGYRSSATSDIWLQDLSTGRFTQLTDFDGPDSQPLWMPDNRNLYYLSERDGTYNLWKMDVSNKRAQQVTTYKGDGVRFPQIAANGSVLAYEYQMGVYVMSLQGSPSPKKLSIFAPTNDARRSDGAWRTFAGDVSEFAVAPNGKEVAFTVRGEIFVTRFPDGGNPRRITETLEPESGLTWSPDSKSIVYAYEQDGLSDLYLVTSADPEEARLRRTDAIKPERLTNTPDVEISPVFSPDGKKIAFQRGRGELVVMDVASRQEKSLLKHWNLGSFEWSPDSRWIVYEMSDKEYNTDVYIISAEGGSPVNISRHPNNDYSPTWSADGRAIAFVSERGGQSTNLHFVFLRKEEDEKTKADWDDEEDAKHDAPKPKSPLAASGSTEPKEKEKEPVHIDFEDIHDRVRRVTNYVTSVSSPALSPDGKKIAYRSSHQGQDDLYVINWDGSEEKRLTTGGVAPTAIRWSSDGNSIYFLSRGRISRVSASTGGTTQSTNTSVQIRVDTAAERDYIFQAAWQTINEQFYDPNFHGIDWQAMRTKYAAYLPYASEDRDFTAVIYMMLGELNSSHISFSRSRPPAADSSETSSLGVVWSNERTGEGLLIERVLPETPASRKEVNLQPGERVLAIDGKRITPQTNVWALLDRKAGEKVRVLVRDKAGTERTVELRPISTAAHSNAHYNDWVKRNQKRVEERSGGQLAYVHIRGMNTPSLHEFVRQLYAAAHDKKGLLIDVRNNGGGSTADYVMTILSVKRHAYTVGREGEPGYPQDRLPLYAWTKPAAVLCNESSFSNAEIFAHAFKTLKRGPVIGVPTAGGVISTGRRTLMDGSGISTPGRGWYHIHTGVNLEGNGAVPDYIIEHSPSDIAEGNDRQLEKAIEVMLGAVRNAPPEFPEKR